MRSYVAEYDLATPQGLPGVMELLNAGEGWKPIAGGTDLMVLFNAGRLPYRKLVSIREIEPLRRIEVGEEHVSIGSAVTYGDLRGHDLLRREFPLLCQAASWTGGIANQNRGTLGGNIANASPAADSAPVLLVYEAELKVVSAIGSRWIRYADFHTGYKQVDLREDELIAKIRLPRVRRDTRQYGRKVGTRKAQAISKVSIAAAAEMEGGTILDVRIAVGSVAPLPLRCVHTERLLQGRQLTAALRAEAQQTIVGEIRPITDIRSTCEYRSMVTANLLGEFLQGLG